MNSSADIHETSSSRSSPAGPLKLLRDPAEANLGLKTASLWDEVVEVTKAFSNSLLMSFLSPFTNDAVFLKAFVNPLLRLTPNLGLNDSLTKTACGESTSESQRVNHKFIQ